MAFPKGSRIHTALSSLARDDAMPEKVAAAVVSTWQDIERALDPIIGRRGVAALYRRSLYLAADEHAWLIGAHDGADTPMNLDALQGLLEHQDAVEGRPRAVRCSGRSASSSQA